MERAPLLVVDSLRKSYGDFKAVKGVSFEVFPGETYGLLGPNGAGKTTLISMIAGVLSRDAGEVTLAGTQVSSDVPASRRDIGLVPQDLAIYPDLTGRENLAFFGRLHGLRGQGLWRRVDEVLTVAGLADRSHQRVKEYSGGMKRRLNIAVGLLHSPKLLILDEPTVGVDPQSRNSILESVEALADEGVAVLYTTHYMEEAERLCDRIGIIDEGELRAEGTRRELVRLVGSEDVIEVEASGDLAEASAALKGFTGVDRVDVTFTGLQVTAVGGAGLLARLVQVLDGAGVTLSRVDVREADLESVFLSLTGKELRD